MPGTTSGHGLLSRSVPVIRVVHIRGSCSPPLTSVPSQTPNQYSCRGPRLRTRTGNPACVSKRVTGLQATGISLRIIQFTSEWIVLFINPTNSCCCLLGSKFVQIRQQGFFKGLAGFVPDESKDVNSRADQNLQEHLLGDDVWPTSHRACKPSRHPRLLSQFDHWCHICPDREQYPSCLREAT